MVKYLFAKAALEGKMSERLKELYERHICLRTGGVEDDKGTSEDYTSRFRQLIRRIQSEGYNADYPIPVSAQTGDILGGAHRIACCLALGLAPTVSVVSEKLCPQWEPWDYSWFERCAFSTSDTDLLLRTYVSLKRETTLAFVLWGAAKAHWPRILTQIGERATVAGVREFDFPVNVLQEVVRDIYAYEAGPRVSDSIERKANLLLRHAPSICLVLVSCENPTYSHDAVTGRRICEEAQQLKIAVRQAWDASVPMDEFVTIHSADSPEHVSYLADYLLSAANRELVMLRPPAGRFRPLFTEYLCEYREVLRSMGIDHDACCVVGSGPLEVLGMRHATDIDFVLDSDHRHARFGPDCRRLSRHVDIACEGYHRRPGGEEAISDDDLVHTDDFHFLFRALKFASPWIVRDRKAWQARPKDRLDVELIDAALGAAGAPGRQPGGHSAAFRHLRRWYAYRLMPWVYARIWFALRRWLGGLLTPRQKRVVRHLLRRHG